MERITVTDLKRATTYKEQVDILRHRNVRIEDPSFCIDVLASVNYYRLSAYFLPFRQSDGLYRENTSFLQIYHIYEFDRKLRNILFSALEEVEVFIRAKLAYYHAHHYGPEGYMNPDCFSHNHQSEKFHENLRREISANQRSAFVAHHQNNYEGRFPVWAVVELFSFGMLSRFYSDMKTADQKALARELYHTIPKNIISWLRCCTDLRNICAHYGRLYYRIFPAIPANVPASPQQARQLLGAVLALKALYPDQRKWNTEILPKLSALFGEYENDISLNHIGFPENWEDILSQ